jgi:hypothetical protein
VISMFGGFLPNHDHGHSLKTNSLNLTAKSRRVGHCRRTEGYLNTKQLDYVVAKLKKKGIQKLIVMEYNNFVLYHSHTSPRPLPNPLYIMVQGP